MNKEFDILENPWWCSLYSSPVSKLLERIERYQGEAINKISLDDPFWIGYVKVHHTKYLLELITGECRVDTKVTYAYVEKLLNTNSLTELFIYLFKRKKYRLFRKLKNLDHSTQILFPNVSLFKQLSLQKLDVNFVRDIHKILGKGIISDAGKFRTKDARPSQENYSYLSPGLIEHHLEKLLKECRQIFTNSELSLADAVKYGACFLADFLFIHPFSNGNGKVGRLLLSYLLAKYTIVPLSLFTAKTRRNTYLQCFRETRKHNAEFRKPASLSRFILENIENEFTDMFYLLEFDKIKVNKSMLIE